MVSTFGIIPWVGLLARKRGGSDAEVSTPGIPALVQLRSERRREQPDQPLERHVDLHRSRNGQLGGRYFQPPDQRQTAFACGFAAKRSLPRAPDEHLSFLSIWLDAIQRFTTKLGEMAEDRPYGDNSLIAQRGH